MAPSMPNGRPQSPSGARPVSEPYAKTIDDLLDPGSFIEYGSLVVAARRKRHSLEKLIEQTPADGMVMLGLGRVNGARFGDEAARCAVMAYDYTVLAGTQGAYNHRKMDRLIEIAAKWRVPTVFFCEGGGGRPGDTEGGGYVRGFEAVGVIVRPRADDWHHVRPLLRGQRLGARLLRCHHRHQGFQHRHGRPGNDRGRRTRDIQAGGNWSR